MRGFLFFLPLLLLAQAPPAAPPKPATKAGAAPTSTPKAGTPAPAPSRSAAPRPAAAGASAAGTPARGTTAPRPAPLTTDEQKTVYALGISIQHSLREFALTPAELEIIKRALTDAAAGKPAVDFKEWEPKIQALAEGRADRVLAQEKAASAAYLAKAATQPGAAKTESGIVYRDLTAGTGAAPTAFDTVKVHYRGTLIDGTEFDSSYRRNEPAEFPLANVVKCWTEGVQKMKVGGKAVLVCPSDVAYGDRGRPPVIPGGAALIFEIELLEIPGK